MACRFQRPTAEAIWPTLLACHEFLSSGEERTGGHIRFCRDGDRWRFDVGAPEGEDEFGFDLRDAWAESVSDIEWPVFLEPEHATLFRLYLPMLLGGYRARIDGGTFVTAHVAQTLDGRIACENGHSQWISNEANLHHAHRLRALHDAVLVGAQTVATDDPRLTVRHVAGRDPTRVVLSASGEVLRRNASRHIFEAPGCIVIRATGAPDAQHEHVRVHEVESEGLGRISPASVGALLAREGLHSIFLEGGSTTLSSFLEAGAVDLLHVHVAPMILGSGVASFSLPAVATIQEAHTLRMRHFEMEGEILFECRPRR